MGKHIIFCIVYTFVYTFLAIACINPEGTGTGIFLIPLITWVLLFFVFYLSNKLDIKRNRVFFVIFLTSHYLINLFFLWLFLNESYKGESRILRMWRLDNYFLITTVLWYLLGQVVLWSIFFFSKKSNGIELEG
jgi:hypothetical protein